MPIEISELVIKATINDTNNTQPNRNSTTQSASTTLDDKVVQKMVDQVMKKWKNKNER